MRLRYASVPVLLVAFASALPAQDTIPIRGGQAISGTLASDSKHRYTIELDDSTFVYGHVNQLTVDVEVTVFDSKNEQIETFDAPARGPETFTFESGPRGRYAIEVTPFEQAEGDYVIEIVRVEPIARRPETRVDQLLLPFAGRDTPGAVVAVVDRGRMRFLRAYGMAELTYGIPFEANTVSNIGSVTKQFTAMGILLLQAEGKLSLEDDIRTYVPELPDFGARISIRNLLTHTGGYREIYNLLPMAGYDGEDVFPREKAIQIVQRQPDLQAQPGTEFNYNNTGYILLAMAIERITDTSFPAYMKAKVFTPLDMNDTRVMAEQGEIIPRSAHGYVSADSGGYRAARDLAGSYGAGGIYTTASDLAKWMMNYRDHTLGGAAAVAAITTNTILENGDSTGYGLGLGLGTFRGRRRYQHTGGDVAHRAYFGYYPELESGVIILSSNGSFRLNIATPIALAFFGDRFDPVPPDTAAAGGGMSEERMRVIAGDWRIVGPSTSLDMVYTVADGQLHAQATGQPRFKLVATSDTTAAFDGVEATVTFHFRADGTVDSATHHQGGAMPMIRVEKVELTAEALAEFAGGYYSAELETAIELRVADEKLKAYGVRMEERTLSYRGADEFSGRFPFATLAFTRSGSGRITGFMASNGRTKNVWFRRE